MTETTADRVAETLLSEHGDVLRRLVTRTRDTGHEQAVTAFRNEDDEWDVSTGESGTATSVTIPPSPRGTFETIATHTHPIPGPVGFSVEDYHQFARFYVMSQPFDASPVRGYAVVGQRFPDIERGTAVVHVIAPTRELTDLSIFDRHGIISTVEDIAMQTPREDRELSFPQTDAIREAFEPYTTETYRQFDVEPADAQSLVATANSPVFK